MLKWRGDIQGESDMYIYNLHVLLCSFIRRLNNRTEHELNWMGHRLQNTIIV